MCVCVCVRARGIMYYVGMYVRMYVCMCMYDVCM